MSEWWTYRPSDFLMFSARSWERLVAQANEAWWPWQVPLALGAVALVVLAWRRPQAASRPAMALLALAWAWVAAAFLWDRFSEINTGARWLAGGFALQAGLLATLGVRTPGRDPPAVLRRLGLGLAILALAFPLLAPFTGQGWMQAEVAGALPDPTALLTAGLLLVLPQRHRGALLVLPVLALVAGGTTAWLLRMQ